MIIARYLTKEISLAFISITGILLLIALSNRFALFLTKAATGELPVGFVFNIVWLYIPELLTILIPLSLFLAILFAFSRLHAESEMAVLSSCGISQAFITKITLIIGTVITFIVAILSLWVAPSLSNHREKALSEGEALAVVQSVMPGRFQMFGEGNLVFYLEDIDSKHNTMKGVFIAELPADPSSGESFSLITAKEARIERKEKTKDFYLVLNNGYRYKGTPGSGDYTVVKFGEYGRAVQNHVGAISSDLMRIKSSTTLLKSGSKEDIAEFQWRLSIPISVCILALIAIPLARVRPRQGRFANFLPALIVYIVYYNLFTLAKRWVASGMIPSIPGVFWVHFIFLCIAFMLLANETGKFSDLFLKPSRFLRFRNFTRLNKFTKYIRFTRLTPFTRFRSNSDEV